MTPEQRKEYKALRARIAEQVAYERRVIRRCLTLIEPLLSVAGYEARVVLYPREQLPENRNVTGNRADRA